MSRHQAVKNMIKNGQYIDDDDEEYDDPYQEDDGYDVDIYHDSNFTTDQLRDIAELTFEFTDIFTRNQVIDALYETDGDYDAARGILANKLDLMHKKNQQKKETKKENKKETKAPQQAPQQKQQQAPKTAIEADLPDLGSLPLQRQVSAEQKSKNQFQIDFNLQVFNAPYPPIQYKNKPEKANLINIITVGHVDTGKSTLVGKLLHLLKAVDDREIHKQTKEAKRVGRESFSLAFLSDQLQEEKERGITMDVAYKQVEIGGKRFNLMDSPGHHEYVPNMITGAQQAEYAILTVDVAQNAFDKSMQSLYEKAYLMRALGIDCIIVAMNKMDQIQWQEKQYNQVREQTERILLKIGFRQQQLAFVPIAAVQGHNLVEKYSQCTWYKGASLVDYLSKLEVPVRSWDKPFRMVITNKYQQNEGRLKGSCLFGKVESGQVEKGQNCVILPGGILCKVKDIQDNVQKSAFEGQIVELSIQTTLEHEYQNIKQGDMLCCLEYPIPCSNLFTCEIITMELDYPLIRGAQFILHINGAKMPSMLKKMHRILEAGSDETQKKYPRAICSNQRAEVDIECEGLVCMETKGNNGLLSRFVLREKFRTIALGNVREIRVNVDRLKKGRILHEQQI